MAQVKIQVKAWSDPRLKKLAHTLGITHAHAMGLLALLWHNSQSRADENVSDEDLQLWFSDSIALGLDVPAALKISNYLAPTCFKHASSIHMQEKSATLNNETNTIGYATSMLQAYTYKDNNNKELCFKHASSIHIWRVVGCGEIIGISKVYKSRAQKGAKIRWQKQQPIAAVTQPIIEAPTPKKTKTASKKKTIKSDIPVGPKTNELIAYFVDAWGRIYRDSFGQPISYPVDGKDAGAAKRLLKSQGFEKACRLIDAFLQMKTSWLISRRHPISALVNDLPAVVSFAATGKLVTAKTADREATAAANDGVIDRLIAREKSQVIDITPLKKEKINDAAW